ncbi:MAG: gamma-glutamylcyclotransferase family protein, partial [Alphaproteobacteria bacterium]
PPSIADRRTVAEMTAARNAAVSKTPRGMSRRGNLYFAYGANMAVRDMRSRCPGAKRLGTAKLRNFRFRINRDGHATVVPDARKTVFGALWRLTVRDLRALDAFEEIDRGIYIRTRVDVRPPRGGTIPAIIYLAANAEPGRPQRRYIRGIVESARNLKFPAAYRRELSQWEAPQRPGGSPHGSR